jgi:hypothetical protein
LLIREPDKVEARKPRKKRAAGATVTPRLGKNRMLPPG